MGGVTTCPTHPHVSHVNDPHTHTSLMPMPHTCPTSTPHTPTRVPRQRPTRLSRQCPTCPTSTLHTSHPAPPCTTRGWNTRAVGVIPYHCCRHTAKRHSKCYNLQSFLINVFFEDSILRINEYKRYILVHNEVQ